jgi:mannose-6-phosphate isomerase-like protein (cupin superfamily)
MELDVHAPVLLAPGEGEVVTDRPERTLRILADLDDLIVTWFRYEPGEQGPDPHIHHHHTDAFYVLEGEIEVSLGPELTTVEARPGMIAAAPPNLVHTYRNASDDTAVFINLHVPSAGFGDYIRGRNPAFDQHEPPADGGRPVVDAVFCGADDAELVEHDTSALRILCDLPQLSALDLTFSPEFEGVDPHVHEDHVDSFYVLEGVIEFLGGDEPRRGGPGTFFAAPRSTSHGFRNPGPGPLRVFNLHTPPGGFVDRVRANA